MAASTVEQDDDARSVSVDHALGVPTRAGIYRRLRTERRPVSARDAADMFGLHPNVARNHLDTLADAGLVVTGRRKQPAGGRPAKVYVAREQVDDRDGPAVPSGSELAVGILVHLLGTLPDAEHRIERVAGDHGRRLVSSAAGRADRREFDAAAVVAVEALRAAFPEVRLEPTDREDPTVHVAGLEVGLRLVGEADGAVGDALARGLLRGALAAAGAAAHVTSVEGRVRARPDTDTDAAVPVDSIDARGRSYQAGVELAKHEITGIRPGEHLEVLTDTQGAPAAFARWADRAGHAIVDVARVRDVKGRPAVRLLLQRAASSRASSGTRERR